MNASTQMVIEQRVSQERKSKTVAYVLWLLLGFFGAQSFYMGRSGMGVLYIVLWVLSICLLFPFLILGPLWLVDGILLSGAVDRYNQNVRTRISAEALVNSQPGA